MSSRSQAVMPSPAKPALKPPDGVLQRQGISRRQIDRAVAGFDWPNGESATVPPAPPVESHLHGSNGDRNFANLKSHSTSAKIRDNDEGRALLTHWLIHDLAPMLGLDPGRIEIRTDRDAESRTSARGANGLMEGGTIYLHPKRYHPEALDSRYLLAHEAAHVAQSGLVGPADVGAAEREADRIGRAFAARRRVFRPVQALPRGAIAADKDVIAAEPVTAATKEPPPPLAASVKGSRSREIQAIKTALSGLWVSDGDVFNVLQVLEPVAFPVAVAIVGSLEPGERYDLANNVNPPHFKRYRKQVLACYRALTADQFKKLDEDLLEEMPLGGLSTEEREAAAYTVHHLSDGSLRSLLESDNRTMIKLLLAWPALEQKDLEELEKKEAEAAEAEAAEAGRLDALQKKFKGDESVTGVIDRVKALLAGPENLTPKDVRALGQRCITVLDVLAEFVNDAAKIEFIGRTLDSGGLLDKLIEFLPEDARFEPQAHMQTFLALLEARLPEKNIRFTENLLSYGLFDWAVRDREAEFAYRLIRRLPLAAQDRFRKRDNGRWFNRLESNIDQTLADRMDYKGIEVGRDPAGNLYDAAALYAEKLESAEGGSALTLILQEIEKRGISHDTAPKIYADIAVIGGARIEEAPSDTGTKIATDTAVPQPAKPGDKFMPADQTLMDAVVRRLDRLGHIEQLFGALSNDFLYQEDNLASTLKIMLARDPARVQEHARELLDRGFLGLGMVSAREAYLAFQLVKALPDEERQAFMEEDEGALWKRILDEMTAEMRQSLGVNVYVGDRGGKDRASVLGQLLDDGTWTKDNALRLDGLVHMAIAMGEHKFAFEQSKVEFLKFANDAVRVGALRPIFTKYRLYDPKERPNYKPDILKDSEWYQEGVFATLRQIAAGLVFLFDNDFLLFTRTQGANKLKLNELQDVLGGDLSGAKLSDPLAAQTDRKEAPAPNPDANKLTIHLDVGGRVLEVHLPELRIDSVNHHSAGLTFQCGMLTLKNLHLSVAFGTEDETQPSHARLEAGDLTIRDLLLAFRDSLIAVAHLAVAGPRIAAGTTSTEKASGEKPRAGYHVPVPFLARISAAIWYLFKYKGWWGAQSPMNAAEEGLELLRAAEISFGSLHVEGVTTSSGQSIGAIDVHDFAARIGLTRPAYLRAQIGSLDQRIKQLKADKAGEEAVSPLTTQLAKAQTELKELAPKETELVQLETKYIHNRGDFTPEDRKRLDELQQNLTGGAFVDIGSIDVSGISGTVTAEPVHLKGIHGEGQSAALGIGFVTDEDFIRKFAGGEERFDPNAAEKRQPKLSTQVGDAKFALEIATFHTGKITVGGVPTAKDLDDRLAELEKVKDLPGYEGPYAKLRDLRDKALLYERYAAIGISALSSEQREKARTLREELMREPRLVIQSIDLVRAHLDVNLIENTIGVGADEARIKGIDYREKGIEVDEIYAKNLRAKAGASGGIDGWLEWRKNLRTAGAGAELLQFKGVRSSISGFGAEEITIEDLGLDATLGGGQTTAGIRARKIEVKGASTASSAAVLRYREKKLLEKKSRTKAEGEQLKEIQYLLRAFEAEETRLKEAAEVLKKETATPAEKIAALKSQQTSSETVAFLQRQMEIKRLTINDLNIEVSGLGDVLAPDYSFGKAVDEGITVRGGLDEKGQRTALISSATVEDASLQKSAHESTWIDTATLGAVRGSVTYKSNRIDFDGLELDSLSVTNFVYFSSGMSIWGSGSKATATVSKLSVTGHIETPLRDEKAKDGDRYMSRVVLDKFHIDYIEGRGLNYRDDKSGLHVDLKAGKIKDINADGIQVDLPKTDDDHLLIRPTDGGKGTAGIGAVENARIVATTGTGMVINSHVSANKLTAGFADDGTVKVDLQSLNLGGNVTQGDLDVDYNVKARGLHVTLIPGKKGYSGGIKKYRVEHLDEAKASGVAGGKEFDVTIRDGEIGEIVDDGKTITAPDISLPDITLDRLLLNNDKFRIDIPQGQTVSVVGLKLGVTLERNLNPKSKEEFPFNKILVTHFETSFIRMQGMDIMLKDLGLSLKLDKKIGGYIQDLFVMPDVDHPEGFIIEPNNNWKMLGSAGFVKANLYHLTAEMPGLFSATTNVSAGGFTIGFVGDDTMPIDLAKLRLDNIEGNIKGSNFWVKKFRSKFLDVDPNVTAEGIHYDKKTGISVNKLGVEGLRYRNDDLGLTLDIANATLPEDKGIKWPTDGPVSVPRLDITNAFFHIDDILNMGSKGAVGGGTPTKIDPKLLEFLDTLHGDVDGNLHIDADYLHYLQTDFPLRVRIREGKVDYGTLRDKALTSHILRHAIDFEVKGNKLIFQIDGKVLATELGAIAGFLSPIPGGTILGGGAGWIGGAAGTAAYGDLQSWNLDPNDPKGNEVSSARRGLARVRTLAKPFLPDGTKKPAEPEGAPLDEIKDVKITIDKADLSLKGESVIDLANLGAKGRIKLGGLGEDGISHLTFKGDNYAGFQIGLNEANVGVEGLEFATDTKNIKINVPKIHIDKLAESKLSFSKGRKGRVKHLQIFPGELEGTVTSAFVENLTVDIKDKGEPAGGKK
jgi:hypothetical protein